MKNSIAHFGLAVALGSLLTSVQAVVLPVAENTSSTTAGKINKTTGTAATLAVAAKQQAFLTFDLSTLPASVTASNITSARLNLFVTSVATPGDLTVHVVTNAWQEITVSIDTPGFSSSVVGTIRASDLVASSFIEVDVTPAVTNWFNGATNFGFAIATATGAVHLGSKEGLGTGFPAMLEIEAADATLLDVTQLTNGVLPLTSLPDAVVTNTETGVTLGGAFSGDGSALTHLTAAALNGGTNTNALTFSNTNNVFAGNGAGLTNLNLTNLTAGTAGISISGNAATATTAGSFTGSLAGDVTGTQGATIVATSYGHVIVTNNEIGVTLSGTFSGDGSGLANIVATSFIGNYTNNFTNEVALTNTANVFAGTGFTNYGVYLQTNSSGNGAFAQLTTNAHLRLTDEYGTTYDTHTNGTLTIAMTNGTTLNWSNGSLILSSNGVGFLYSQGSLILGTNLTVSNNAAIGGALIVTGVITGNGANLTNLTASNIVAGTAGISITGNAATASYATNAGTANFASNVVSGAYVTNVILTNSTFYGSGAGLASVNAATVQGLGTNSLWTLTGNAGTTPGAQFLGTADNIALELHVNGARALLLQPNASGPNVIGGLSNNSVAPDVYQSVIAGGGTNAIQTGAWQSIIGGGGANTIGAGAYNSTIAGGDDNAIQSGASESTIAGGGGTDWGQGNIIQSGAYDSTIGGGSDNTIGTSAFESTIGGGVVNTIGTSDQDSTIGGGDFNSIGANNIESIIVGGSGNSMGVNASDSTIAGGANNTIGANAYESTIAGGGSLDSGIGNTTQSGAHDSFIGGGSGNTVGTNAVESTIAGGVANTIKADASDSVIAGGVSNTIGTSSYTSTIAGGGANIIGTNSYDSTIGAGVSNNIQSNSAYSTIAGGDENTIETNAVESTIAGGGSQDSGMGNTIQGYANDSFIGGGSGNTIEYDAYESTIDGGYGNTIELYSYDSLIGGGSSNTISSYLATVGGGYGNTSSGVGAFVGGGGCDGFGLAGNTASGNASVVGGGMTNVSSGSYAVIPGGYSNLASGYYSFAAGNQAQAVHTGAFVWADSQSAIFSSTANNTFNVRAEGGVRFTSGGSGSDDTVAWSPGTGSWTFSSDHNLKDRFAPVDEASVLDKVARLPLSEWSYKGYGQRHIGVMAQDFHALFPLNDNDKVLNDLDLHGVELAAIQGLNQKLETELKAKDAEIKALEERLQRLENKMAHSPNE